MATDFDQVVLETWADSQSRNITRTGFFKSNRLALAPFLQSGGVAMAANLGSDADYTNGAMDKLANYACGRGIYASEILKGNFNQFLANIDARLQNLEFHNFDVREYRAFEAQCREDVKSL